MSVFVGHSWLFHNPVPAGTASSISVRLGSVVAAVPVWGRRQSRGVQLSKAHGR